MIFRDVTGYTLKLEHTPKRVVSLVPSLTETLYDLGLEEILVGVTKFCVHPTHIKATCTQIGGTKNVHIDKVRDLCPDLIIANKEENTKETIEALRLFCPVYVTEITSLDDMLDLLQTFGVLFNKRTEAQKWCGKIQFGYTDFISFMAIRPEYKAAYFIWANPYMVAGNGTYIHYMMRLNKFYNIYGNKERYPEIELKKIRLEGDPDLVLLSSEPFPFKDEHAFEIGRFTHHAKAVFVDGEMFSWYGTRVVKAFEYFKQLHLKLAD